jgi:RimJ/RimL family protein N-acetyltransferase
VRLLNTNLLIRLKFWEPPHKRIEETEHMINKYVENYNDKDCYMWAVVYENELIGLAYGNGILISDII